MLEFLQHIDEQLLLFVNGQHSPYFDLVMSAFSGRFVWIPMYLSIAYLLFQNLNWKEALLYVAVIGAAIAATDMVCAKAIRPAVERLRPANLENPLSAFVHIVDGYRGGRYGFPSCHAANSFCLAVISALIIRRKAFAWFIFLWAVVNSYSRMYLGVHYPGDLIVGGLVGSALAIGFYYLLKQLSQKLQLKSQVYTYYSIPISVGVATAVVILIVSAIQLF